MLQHSQNNKGMVLHFCLPYSLKKTVLLFIGAANFQSFSTVKEVLTEEDVAAFSKRQETIKVVKGSLFALEQKLVYKF